MREILFRGKRFDEDEWIYGSLLDDVIVTKGATDVDDDYIGFSDDWSSVVPETVGQYIGLNDKNGSRIFEGDIIFCKKPIEGNHIDYCIEFGFVEMKYGAFGLHRKQGFYRSFKDFLEDYEYEVVGNIYDNPELLERGTP